MNILIVLENNHGSVINIALLVLILLSTIAISSSKTTTVEVQIATNELNSQRAFYSAETGWRIGVNWLDSLYPLSTDSLGLDTSGGGINFTSANAGAADSNTLDGNNQYSVTMTFNGASSPDGYGADFKRFDYSVSATGTGSRNSSSSVTVTAGKIDLVGNY
jgi:Tfp pilus assembly protein PilX